MIVRERAVSLLLILLPPMFGLSILPMRLLLFSGLAITLVEVVASPVQLPLHVDSIKPRKLQGRFLHITDLHLDPYYRFDASISSACHRNNKKKKKKTRSGYYGTPYSKCDSPLRLVNFTLNYLGDKWAKHIDFVIWTGDSARHDNDRKTPRTLKEIYQINRGVAEQMQEVFKNIPVVPTLGNNDVWPHNILEAGPNPITNEFSSIWKSFIPFPSYQVFRRGAYFSVEVIPNALAVISLNTMYFYDSNKVMGGCEFQEPQDPGNLQLDWLEVQLDSFRSRGLKVWLMGHVPPSTKNYFSECYFRYTEISLRFQDTILGHLYGHMNADHFSFIRADDLDFPESDGSRMEANMRSSLDKLLLDDFAGLPKNINYSRYGIVNVSPSVVPNPYLPSFRIYSYNISEAAIADDEERRRKRSGNDEHDGPGRGAKIDLCKTEHKGTWRCQFSKAWHIDPDAPSRKNGLWTPLGYAQYFIPKLDDANVVDEPKYRLEYMTYGVDMLHPTLNQTNFQYPIPPPRLPRMLRDRTATDNKYTPYGLRDLTIPSWMGLARKLGDVKNKKLRKGFKKYMYMGR